MASRNFGRLQALEKEIKQIYAELTFSSGSAPTAPFLGAAASFSVLASSTVTNTGASVVSGNLGLSAGTSVTGFPPGTVTNGSQHVADSAASNAQLAAAAAYIDLAARSVTTNYSGTDLGTLTLGPGVYKFNTSAQLTGTLTLDAAGDPDAVFVFQIGSTLTTASASVVSLLNSASAANVFWQVGSSATLGTTTNFKGTIIALASITVNTGASIQGRALARTAAVTLDTNAITNIVPTIVLERGLGVASVERMSSGVYKLTLEDRYMRLMNCSVSVQSPVAQDLQPQLVSESVLTTKFITFRLLAGDLETDASSDCTIYVGMDLKNSSVPY